MLHDKTFDKTKNSIIPIAYSIIPFAMHTAHCTHRRTQTHCNYIIFCLTLQPLKLFHSICLCSCALVFLLFVCVFCCFFHLRTHNNFIIARLFQMCPFALFSCVCICVRIAFDSSNRSEMLVSIGMESSKPELRFPDENLGQFYRILVIWSKLKYSFEKAVFCLIYVYRLEIWSVPSLIFSLGRLLWLRSLGNEHAENRCHFFIWHRTYTNQFTMHTIRE